MVQLHLVPEPATRVMFRKFGEGDIIAIFPDEEWSRHRGNRFVASYMHVGQHGGCDTSLMSELDVATPDEYADLKRELESEPYKYVLELLP